MSPRPTNSAGNTSRTPNNATSGPRDFVVVIPPASTTADGPFPDWGGGTTPRAGFLVPTRSDADISSPDRESPQHSVEAFTITDLTPRPKYRLRAYHLLAALPSIGLLGGVPFANRVHSLVLGLPFLLLW